MEVFLLEKASQSQDKKPATGGGKRNKFLSFFRKDSREPQGGGGSKTPQAEGGTSYKERQAKGRRRVLQKSASVMDRFVVMTSSTLS